MKNRIHSCVPYILLLLFICPLNATAELASGDYLSFKTEDESNNIEIFKKASPSVVFVTNTTLRRDMFSLNIQEIPQGSGTGFIWSDEGIVVTNFHVIQGANKVIITFNDQSSWDASVIGVAPDKDLAVLRIETPRAKLSALPLGDSSLLEVGRKVIAIGNPFGLDTTMTVGVVSALEREIDSADNRKIRGAIQTDASINPGNSGGPLLNSLGQLIGVNTAIYSPSGASAGIGFAIPVNTVKKIVPQLIKHGHVIRPILGVETGPDNWVQRYGLNGIPIVRVTPGLPASTVGLRGVSRNARGQIVLGDIIVALNGKDVTTNDDLLTALEDFKPGDKVEVKIMRDDKLQKFMLRLANPDR